MKTIDIIRKQQASAECMRLAEHSDKLAESTVYGTPGFKQMCRNNAQAFRLEAETGICHCVCHLLPMETCRQRQARR